jgi:hypothetical protein
MRLLWIFLGIHAAMVAYDATHPGIFLNADRAPARTEAIQGLYEAAAQGKTTLYLTQHGIVGDYAPQAIIMAVSGAMGLILVQVMLMLLAGYAVFRLGLLLRLSTKLTALACGIYLAMPHSLVFPHQLISEALSIPLLVISIWLIAEFVAKPQWGLLITSGLLVGLANLIRPISLLWPVLVALFLWRTYRAKSGLEYLAVAMLPIFIWIGFLGVQTGKFELGESAHDMVHNLYQRVWRISKTLPPEEAAQARAEFLDQGETGKLSVFEYLKFGLHYPLPFLQQAARDTLIFVAKSGIERIPIDYFEFNREVRKEMQDARSGWQSHFEKEGVIAALRYLLRIQGLTLLISLAGSLVMILLMGLAISGAWHLLSEYSGQLLSQRFTAMLLICLPLYILIFSQVIEFVQSRHRAPAEAALVLLAVLGGERMSGRFSQFVPFGGFTSRVSGRNPERTRLRT